MSGTDDLATFLRARLDEDEQMARAATEGAEGRWTQDDPKRMPGEIWDDHAERVSYDEGRPTEDQAAHIARHDPARVLREVEAKRMTFVRCQEEMLSGIPRLVHFAKQTLWEMSQSYADHEDFSEGWRP
jgi:hypothetical protein